MVMHPFFHPAILSFVVLRRTEIPIFRFLIRLDFYHKVAKTPSIFLLLKICVTHPELACGELGRTSRRNPVILSKNEIRDTNHEIQLHPNAQVRSTKIRKK
jgi:hypothetical protein